MVDVLILRDGFFYSNLKNLNNAIVVDAQEIWLHLLRMWDRRREISFWGCLSVIFIIWVKSIKTSKKARLKTKQKWDVTKNIAKGVCGQKEGYLPDSPHLYFPSFPAYIRMNILGFLFKTPDDTPPSSLCCSRYGIRTLAGSGKSSHPQESSGSFMYSRRTAVFLAGSG